MLVIIFLMIGVCGCTCVGNTTIYHIGHGLKQLTTDQTFVTGEISKGTMTMEQAKRDKRRNMLL